MSVRNATNSAAVCRAAVLPSTSPVLVSNAAYNDSVPCRKHSKPCRSARPGESGNTGSLRSSALIAVFSSTQKTAACAGGFRYSPMMSAAFCSKSGSSVAIYRSSRCGFRACLAHTRATIMCRSQRASPLPGVPAEQPGQALLPKSLAPAIDKRIIAVQLVANHGPRMAGLQQQYQPPPARIIGTPTTARRSLAELHTFRIGQYDRLLHEHYHTIVLDVTVH